MNDRQKKSRYIPGSSEKSTRLSQSELAQLVALKRKKGRREQGLFLAEGVRLLEEALKFKRLPRVVFTFEPELSERGKQLVSGFRAKRVAQRTLSSRDFHKLAETVQPQGIVGVFERPILDIASLQISSRSRILVVENINDPGNLGSLIRSAAGFGFDPIILLGDTVEPFSPKVVRSSAGSIFASSIVECDLERFHEIKRRLKLPLLVTDIRGEEETYWLKGVSLDQPLALAVCSESNGSSEGLEQLADKLIRLSHSAALESLNASFAGAIAMHYIYLKATRED